MRSPLRRRAFWLPITLSVATAAGLIAWTLHRASVDEDTLSVGANREPESFADGHARAIVHLGKRIGRIDTRVAPSPEGGVRLEERTALSVRRRGRTAITSRTLVAHTDAQGALVSARMESGAGTVEARVDGTTIRWTLKTREGERTFTDVAQSRGLRIHVEPLLLPMIAGGVLRGSGRAALLDLEHARTRSVGYQSARQDAGFSVRLLEAYGVATHLFIDARGRVVKGDTVIPGVTTRAFTKADEAAPLHAVDLTSWGEVMVSGAMPADDHAPLRLRLRGLPGGFDTSVLPGHWDRVRGAWFVDLGQPEARAPSAEELSAAMRPSPFIESDAREIQELAVTLNLHGHTRLEAAARVTRHLRERLRVADAIGPPSALTALRARRGNCNEWASLAVALLRAGGHPARLAFGVARVGAGLRYHAWAELAEPTGFRGFDPMLGRVPVGASYLRLSAGGVEAQGAILAATGRLTLEVVPLDGGPR